MKRIFGDQNDDDNEDEDAETPNASIIGKIRVKNDLFRLPTPHDGDNVTDTPTQPDGFGKIGIIHPNSLIQLSSSNNNTKTAQPLEDSESRDSPIGFESYGFFPIPSTSQLHPQDENYVAAEEENLFKAQARVAGTPAQPNDFGKVNIIRSNTIEIQSTPTSNETKTAQQQPNEEIEWPHHRSPTDFGRFHLTPTPSTSHLYSHDGDNVSDGQNAFNVSAPAIDTRTQCSGFGKIRIVNPNSQIPPSDINSPTSQKRSFEESEWPYYDSPIYFKRYESSPIPSTSQLHPRDSDFPAVEEISINAPCSAMDRPAQCGNFPKIRILDANASTSAPSYITTAQHRPSEDSSFNVPVQDKDPSAQPSDFGKTRIIDDFTPTPSTSQDEPQPLGLAQQPRMAPFGDFSVITDEPVNDAMFMRGTLDACAAHGNSVKCYHIENRVVARVRKMNLAKKTGNKLDIRKLALSMDMQATIYGIAGDGIFKIFPDGSVEVFRHDWGELTSIDIPDEVFVLVGTAEGRILAIEQETMRLEFSVAVSAEPVTTVRNYGLHAFALTGNSAMAANKAEEILEYGNSHASSMLCGVVHGDFFIIGTADGKLLRFTLPNLALYEANDISSGVAITSMASLGDSLVVLGFEDGFIKIFATFPTYEITVVGYVAREVFGLDVSFDQNWLLSCDGGGLKLFKLENIQEHREAARRFQQSTYADIPVKQEPLDDTYGFLNIKEEPEDTFDFDY